MYFIQFKIYNEHRNNINSCSSTEVQTRALQTENKLFSIANLSFPSKHCNHWSEKIFKKKSFSNLCQINCSHFDGQNCSISEIVRYFDTCTRKLTSLVNKHFMVKWQQLTPLMAIESNGQLRDTLRIDENYGQSNEKKTLGLILLTCIEHVEFSNGVLVYAVWLMLNNHSKHETQNTILFLFYFVVYLFLLIHWMAECEWKKDNPGSSFP